MRSGADMPSTDLTDTSSMRDDLTALQTSMRWIKWVGGVTGATVVVAAVKYIVFTPWG